MEVTQTMRMEPQGTPTGKGKRITINIYGSTYKKLLKLQQVRETMDDLIDRVLQEREFAIDRINAQRGGK